MLVLRAGNNTEQKKGCRMIKYVSIPGEVSLGFVCRIPGGGGAWKRLNKGGDVNETCQRNPRGVNAY